MAASMSNKRKDAKSDDSKPVVVAKTAVDFQRLKLERLMKNPDKPVPIPEPPREKLMSAPPEFNRNVMGSSAGAGSGEFHVYRHIRRREYARQKYISERAEKEDKDMEYHRRVEENRRIAEERTAKKRAKRQKKKLRAKLRKEDKSNNAAKVVKSPEEQQDSEDGEDDDDNDDDDITATNQNLSET